MKVIIHNAARVWGGNEKWLATVAEGMGRRGHQVVVSCRAQGEIADRLRQRGIRTAPVRPGAFLDLPRALRFAAWLKQERPDAVLLTSWKETFWGAWAAKSVAVPRVVVRLGIVRIPRRRHHVLPLRRWVDAIIVNAPDIRDALQTAAPWLSADRIHVILNGIEAPDVDSHNTRVRLRSRLGVSSETLLIGGAGHVTARKGFDILLRAFAKANLPHAHLVIIGSGPQLDGLQTLAAGLGIADRVHWLGQQDDVPTLLAGCDAFILSSRNEGMANVMLEAMAMRVPVIATDISGVRAAIGRSEQRGAAGWIVPSEDVQAMADAISEVAAALRLDARAIRERVEEAHWRLEQWFSVERMLAAVEAVLRPPAA
jgi:glycosyltransferase involved in cell wall biosynthesis